MYVLLFALMTIVGEASSGYTYTIPNHATATEVTTNLTPDTVEITRRTVSLSGYTQCAVSISIDSLSAVPQYPVGYTGRATSGVLAVQYSVDGGDTWRWFGGSGSTGTEPTGAVVGVGTMGHHMGAWVEIPPEARTAVVIRAVVAGGSGDGYIRPTEIAFHAE